MESSQTVSSQLSPAVVSLIHHVELTRSDWWNRVIQQLIVDCLYEADSPLDLNSIERNLQAQFSVSITLGQLKTEIQNLLKRQFIIETSKAGEYKVSERYSGEIQANLARYRELTERLKNKYLSLIRPFVDNTVEGDWAVFYEKVILAIIQNLGARSYELFSGKKALLNGLELDSFIENYPIDIHIELQRCVITFFDAEDSDLRTFLFQHLNAYFFLEARNLSSKTLAKINQLLKQQKVYAILVDTNFVLSILDLDNHPSSEIAKYLLSVSSKLPGKLKVHFYVLPITLEEAKGKLIHEEASLRQIRVNRIISRVTRNVNLGHSGIAEKYFQKYLSQDSPPSPEDYLRPYIHNLKMLLEEKGVKVFEDSTAKLKREQKVIDDINNQIEYEEKNYSPDRRKSYKAIEHDMVLWHFARDKRPTIVDTPLDAHYWIVTLDNKLVRFDTYKSGGDKTYTPIVLLPASLVQMLQLWQPRDDDYEIAILNGVKSFLFNDFSYDAEQITIRILKALAQFEDRDDLSENAMLQVLLNEALQQRISQSKDDKEDVRLVRDVLLEETKHLVGQLQEQKLAVEALTRQQASEIISQAERLRILNERLEVIETQEVNARELEKIQQARNIFIRQFALAISLPLIVLPFMALVIRVLGSNIYQWALLIVLFCTDFILAKALHYAEANVHLTDIATTKRIRTTHARLRWINLAVLAAVLGDIFI